MKQNYIMPKAKVPTTTPLKEVTEPTFGESPKAQTRAGVRRNSAEDVNLVNVEETFGVLAEVLGTTNISAPDASISPVEIDVLAAELIAVRSAKDIVEGRESALKAYATEVINMRIATTGKDFANESGYLVSPENGVKLSKEVSGGKLNVDVDLLKDILDDDQYKSVINVVETNRVTTFPDGKVITEHTTECELNEEALEKELKLGNIGMEQVIKATTPGKVRSAFYVRSL